MIWAQLYLAAFLLMSLGGFLVDARTRRTPSEFAINAIAVAAPAMLVLAYIEPDLFEYRGSLLALFGITAASNWIGGRMYLREFNEEAPQDEELNFWSIILGAIVMLAPAFWFGAIAYARG